MNRFDRITAILVQLHTRRVVRAQDLAERFGVSLRTIYRDVRSLEEAGVPISGEAGVGYALMEGYRLPPVHFTKEEALSLVMADKIVERLTDEATRRQYQSALDKIKAVLQSRDKDLLERVEDSIQILRPNLAGAGHPALLQPLMSALAERQVVEITYQGQEDEAPQARVLEPVGLFQQTLFWYLIAYCRLRQAYRTFRTDRILSLLPTHEVFTGQHPTLSAYLAQVASERQLDRVVIEVDASIVPYVRNQAAGWGQVECVERGDVVQMTFLTSTQEGLGRWVLSMSGHARVLEPAGLQDCIVGWAEQLIKKYRPAETLLT